MGLFGHGGLLSKVSESLLGGSNPGEIINNITGQTQSANTQYKNALALQKNAQEFAKWQMGNAHQMEIQDLEKAGINPILSAGGGGANGSVSANSASTGSASGNPLEIIMGMINTAKGIEKINADIKNETAKTDADVTKTLKDAGYTDKQIEYYNTYGVFPGATISTSTKTPWGASSETIPVGLKTDHANTSAKKTKERQDKKNKEKKEYPTNERIGNNGNWWY